MKGAVYQRGKSWTFRFRAPERDAGTGEYLWITKGGFPTEKEAWKACRDAMRDADRGRVVRSSARTVGQFFDEWFTAIEPTIDATTWRNWRTMRTPTSCRVSARNGCSHSTSLSCSGCTGPS
jgi:hypothetical protein